MYHQISHDIEIVVVPTFLSDQSDPENGRWFWAYQISISNFTGMAVQLVARHWEITNGVGHVETVDGPGVIGEQPIIGSGGTFTYTSGCPLNTPSGTMVGHYMMEREDGTGFTAQIPAFSLDLPDAARVLN